MADEEYDASKYYYPPGKTEPELKPEFANAAAMGAVTGTVAPPEVSEVSGPSEANTSESVEIAPVGPKEEQA